MSDSFKFDSQDLQYNPIVLSSRQRMLGRFKGGVYSLVISVVVIFSLTFAELDTFSQHDIDEVYRDISEAEESLQKMYELISYKQQKSNLFTAILHGEQTGQNVLNAGFGGGEVERLFSGDFYSILDSVLDHIGVIDSRLNVLAQSYSSMLMATKYRTEYLATMPTILPFQPRNSVLIGSKFGMRRNAITGRGREFHGGIDFPLPIGEPIYATGDGVVNVSQKKYSRRGYGKYVKIQHNRQYETLYGHLSRVVVSKGQQVRRGEIIGYSGNTGRSSGPHLHYEVHLDKHRVNPYYYFFSDITSEQYGALLANNE